MALPLPKAIQSRRQRHPAAPVREKNLDQATEDASGRLPEGWADRELCQRVAPPCAPLNDLWDPERYEHLARMLEAARFDAGFFADGMGVPDIYKDSFADYLGRGGQLSCWIR